MQQNAKITIINQTKTTISVFFKLTVVLVKVVCRRVLPADINISAHKMQRFATLG